MYFTLNVYYFNYWVKIIKNINSIITNENHHVLLLKYFILLKINNSYKKKNLKTF